MFQIIVEIKRSVQPAECVEYFAFSSSSVTFFHTFHVMWPSNSFSYVQMMRYNDSIKWRIINEIRKEEENGRWRIILICSATTIATTLLLLFLSSSKLTVVIFINKLRFQTHTNTHIFASHITHEWHATCHVMITSLLLLP